MTPELLSMWLAAREPAALKLQSKPTCQKLKTNNNQLKSKKLRQKLATKQRSLKKRKVVSKRRAAPSAHSCPLFPTQNPHPKLPEQYTGANKSCSVFTDDSSIFSAQLVMQERSSTTDKIYTIPVCVCADKICGNITYLFFQHWGRTGSQGQVKTTEFSSVEDAKQKFASKFEEKTSQKWASAITGEFSQVSGRYNFLLEDYSSSAATQRTQERYGVKWQYDLKNDPRGKPDGWYDYDGDATVMDTATFNMEDYHTQWKNNNFLNVRFVSSGDQGFTYKVDFTAMTQTNTSSQKVRPIRRYL
jgi:predicted DNA-binding WGR domain protein